MSQPEEKPVGDVLQPKSDVPEPGARGGAGAMDPDKGIPHAAENDSQPGDDASAVDWESQDG